ncbi:hypothetical protein Tco_1244952 [Tanacetum coccineum]
MVVCKIGKPWGIIITTKGNHPKCLKTKCFRNFLFLDLTLMGIFKSRKVVGGEIFCSFFITDNDIKFLEQQNLPEQSWLSILLSKQVFESRMVRIHYAFGQDKIWPEFLESIHYGKYGYIKKSQENSQKTGKHGHEKRKSTREAKDSKPKPEKVKSQSKKVKP